MQITLVNIHNHLYRRWRKCCRNMYTIKKLVYLKFMFQFHTPTKYDNLMAPGPQSSTPSNPLETSQNANNLYNCSTISPTTSPQEVILFMITSTINHFLSIATSIIHSMKSVPQCHRSRSQTTKSWLLILVNVPINNRKSNFLLYHMSLIQMKHIRNQSTQWRAVCNYSESMSDQRDSVRGRFTDFNPLDEKGL